MKLAFIFKRKKCAKFGARLPSIYTSEDTKRKQIFIKCFPLESINKQLTRLPQPSTDPMALNTTPTPPQLTSSLQQLLNSDVIFQKIVSNIENDDEIFNFIKTHSTNKKQLILDDFISTKFLFDRKLIYNFLNETFNQTDLKYSPFDYKVKVPKFELVNKENYKTVIETILEVKKMKFPLIIKTVSAAGNFNSHLFFIFFSKKSLKEFCEDYFSISNNVITNVSEYRKKIRNGELKLKENGIKSDMNGYHANIESDNFNTNKANKEDICTNTNNKHNNKINNNINNNTKEETNNINNNNNNNNNININTKEETNNINNVNKEDNKHHLKRTKSINTNNFSMLSPGSIFHTPQSHNSEFILQQYYKHDGALIKACVIGNKLFVSKRSSIPDLTKSFHNDKIFFHNFFKGSVFEAKEKTEESKEVSKDIYDVCEFIKNTITDKLKIGLFGFDVIFEDKIAYIIDINYFPTFKEVPELDRELVEYAMEKYNEHCKLNNITNIL